MYWADFSGVVMECNHHSTGESSKVFHQVRGI